MKRDIQHFTVSPADFPIIADTSLAVAKAHDMLPADACLPDCRTPAHTATVRTIYTIGPDKTVRITDGVPLATPANWVPGQDVIVAQALNNEQATEKFGALDIKLPYLRFAKAPVT